MPARRDELRVRQLLHDMQTTFTDRKPKGKDVIRFKAVWQIDQDSPWTSYVRAPDAETAIKKVKSAYDASAHITFVSLHDPLDGCVYGEGSFSPFWNDDMPVSFNQFPPDQPQKAAG